MRATAYSYRLRCLCVAPLAEGFLKRNVINALHLHTLFPYNITVYVMAEELNSG